METNNKLRKLKTAVSILKLLILIGIVVGIPLYLYFYHREFITEFKSLDDITAFLQKYKLASIPIYIGLQALQIIISILPGQAFQLAAGYLYKFLFGLTFSLVGAALGTTISFYIAKILGRDAVHIFFGREKTSYYLEQLNSRKAYTLVFVLYLIPGLPKDVVSYIAGVSEMRFKPFLLTWICFFPYRLPFNGTLHLLLVTFNDLGYGRDDKPHRPKGAQRPGDGQVQWTGHQAVAGI